MDIQLTDRSDLFKWSLNHNGQFSVSSMHQAFLDTNVVPNNSYLWKIKVPLKIRVFLWLLWREVILTKDNLVKRNWNGNVMCNFLAILRPYNIYFLIVHLLSFYEE
jgi:hypothetical protein